MATPTIAIIPSIFKPGVLGSVLPIGGEADLTFTRADGAGNGRGTRINKDGLIQTMDANVPRLDYSDGGCPSLLLEPQSTNLVPQSQAFDNTAWAKVRATITPNTTATSDPTGNNNSDLIKQDPTDTNGGVIVASLTVTASSHTFSFFEKMNDLRYINLAENMSSASTRRTWFDLQGGTVGTTNGAHTAKIQNYGNGWYRCSITFTALGDFNSVFVYLSDGDGSTTAIVNESIYAWGAQLEAQSSATSYISTVGAIATRLADTASKAGLSSYIDSTSGVFEVEIAALSNNQTFRSISISNGTNQNTVIIRYSNITQQIQFVVIIGNSIVYFHGETVADIRVSTKCKLKWDLNNFGAKINDVEVDSQLSGAVYPANTLTKVGFTEGTTTFKFEGYVKNIEVHKGISSY
jgi:hypothetical protein